jgi:hypothetical protein
MSTECHLAEAVCSQAELRKGMIVRISDRRIVLPAVDVLADLPQLAKIIPKTRQPAGVA